MNQVSGNPIGHCPICGAEIGDEHAHTYCTTCSNRLPDDVLAKLPKLAEKLAENESAAQNPSSEIQPLAILLRVLAALSVLAGFISFAALWPGEPTLGYVWKTAAYFNSWRMLLAGIGSAVMLLVLAQVLVYLDQIARNTKR